MTPGACLGNLQGCALGNKGYLCSQCVCDPPPATCYYTGPIGLCQPCGSKLWVLLVFFIAVLLIAGGALLVCPCGQFVGAFKIAWKDHQPAYSAAFRLVTGLSGLHRIRVLPLPSNFKAFLGLAGLLIGMNSGTAGVECSGANWFFGIQFGVTLGGVFGLLLTVLVLHDIPRMLYHTSDHLPRVPRPIHCMHWLVWDAAVALFPTAAQACWAALTINPRDNTLFNEPTTSFSANSDDKARSAFSILFLVGYLSFILERYWPFRRGVFFGGIKTTGDKDQYPTLHLRGISAEEVTTQLVDDFVVALLGFLKDVSIPLQRYNVGEPPRVAISWLLSFSLVEFLWFCAVALYQRRKGISRSSFELAPLFSLPIFVFTISAGLYCANNAAVCGVNVDGVSGKIDTAPGEQLGNWLAGMNGAFIGAVALLGIVDTANAACRVRVAPASSSGGDTPYSPRMHHRAYNVCFKWVSTADPV